MSTGAEFAGHRPHAEEGRADERHVRILLVENQTELADELRHTLCRTERASFEVVCEQDLVDAAAQIRGEHFDLLLMDLRLAGVARSAAIDLANDLAHRLPVVVLTGTEAVAASGGPSLRERFAVCVERSDVAGKLLSAIRRARRLGTGVMTPIFCRLEGF
jgi:DNA-binding NtrC family response regulator